MPPKMSEQEVFESMVVTPEGVKLEGPMSPVDAVQNREIAALKKAFSEHLKRDRERTRDEEGEEGNGFYVKNPDGDPWEAVLSSAEAPHDTENYNGYQKLLDLYVAQTVDGAVRNGEFGKNGFFAFNNGKEKVEDPQTEGERVEQLDERVA